MFFIKYTFLILIYLPGIVLAKVDEKKLVTMAAGQIMDEVVTSRQVNMSFFLEAALFGKKNKKLPESFYTIPSKEFSREVTAVLLERVVFEESKGFNIAKVSAEELKDTKSKFEKIASKNLLWKQLKVSNNELTDLIKFKLQAKKFIRFKVDSSVVPITDDEARAYFEGNREKFGSLPFENFKQNIRAYLGRKQIDKRLKDWFEVLQNKYKVRNFMSEIES